MHFTKKSLTAAVALIFSVMVMSAQRTVPMAALVRLASQGPYPIDRDLYIEAYMISDFCNPNLETSGVRNFSAADQRLNNRTAYIESLNGAVGFRVRGTSQKQLKRFAAGNKVVINLKGTTLEPSDCGAVTVTDFRDEKIVSLTPGTPENLPYRPKTISQLTDMDVYTYVRLVDCEFVFKDGAYINGYETYSVKNKLTAIAEANGIMDTWASELCDAQGSSIYMLLNSGNLWRRDGRGVPAGSGTIDGVIVNSELSRYGGNTLGRYQIRPFSREAIGFSPAVTDSKWKVIAEWTWGNGSGEFATDKGARRKVTSEGLLPDHGSGTITCEVKGNIFRGCDFNNVMILKGANADQHARGRQGCGALTMVVPSREWWDWKSDHGKGILVKFSTAGLAGEKLLLGFNFSGGDIRPENADGFPAWWCVEYSTDGVNFNLLDGAHRMVSLPWWYKNNLYDLNYVTSAEAGFGNTDHCVCLPSELLGVGDVYVRICPADRRLVSLAYEQNDNMANRPNRVKDSYVNFGSVVVRYR